jgi:hypothetical protein
MPTESEPTAEARFTPNKTFVSSTAITPNLSATVTPNPTQIEIATDTPVPTETFAPMELSTDPDKPTKCLWQDVTSGRLAWSTKQNANFPPNTINKGWKSSNASSSSEIKLVAGASGALQRVNICQIDDSFEGISNPNRISYVTSVAYKKMDGSVGAINIFSYNRDYLKGLSDLLSSQNSGNITILRQLNASQTSQHQNDQYAPMFRLYGTEGSDAVSSAIDALENTDDTSLLEKIAVITGKSQ